jgi:MOSC domain-containing protein YiiM
MTSRDSDGAAATGRVVGLQRSGGGVPKRPVERAEVGVNGMEGDTQANRRFHGGPARALCLYSQERIDALVAEGHQVTRGALGENVTISGIPWHEVTPGTRLRIGGVEAEVTGYAAPCEKIGYAFAGGEFKRIGQKVNPGWSRVYVSVLQSGPIAVGDPVSLIPVQRTNKN